jgi:FtsP/CotA-like multicopper oxidase with cupredoxin domain
VTSFADALESICAKSLLMTENTMTKKKNLTRRKAMSQLAAGLIAGNVANLTAHALSKGKNDSSSSSGKGSGKGKGKGGNGGGNDDGPPTTLRFTPFTVPLPLPPVKQPLAIGDPPFQPGAVFHGIAPEYFDRSVAERPDLNWYEAFPTKWYEMRMRNTVHEIIPGVRTPLFAYDGISPGPTFKARVGQPVVVRAWNDLNIETSIHLHGGHNPSHSDGYPNFYVLPGRARDYFYTNTVPMLNGQPDFSESPSTMWYHDHAMDIAAANVWFGLSGFFITTDELEQDLIDRNVLPAEQYDIPLSFQDRRFNPDGTLFFDPLDHDGTLGDVWIVNGKAQPFFRVQRRKYRFRFLNGCNARFLELRLSNGQPFIGLGKDTWLYPNAQERQTLMLSMAQRADVVIDFTDAPNEVFIENTLAQDDGRGPRGQLDDRRALDQPTRFLKFIVEGDRQTDSATVDVGTPLRPHVPIRPAEARVTRTFEFTRRNGAWQINKQFFNEDLANATPTLGTVERWILRNTSGGWWHPIHIHLESHQIVRLNGRTPLPEDSFKNDTVSLDGNGEAEVLMNFRTFRGPFVFHCHNVEHEDMRMMFVFDPRITPTRSPQPIQQRFP